MQKRALCIIGGESSIPANRCIHCGGVHVPNSCPVRYQPKATSGSSNYGSPKQNTRDNNVVSAQVRGNQSRQVSPLVQQNTFAQPIHSNSFPPHPYFPIPFPPPPVPPSNASVAPSAPASDLSAAISLMTNAVNQGNANTTNITDALQRTMLWILHQLCKEDSPPIMQRALFCNLLFLVFMQEAPCLVCLFSSCQKLALVLGNDCERLCTSRPLLGSYVHQESI